jgi:hypothetical protein
MPLHDTGLGNFRRSVDLYRELVADIPEKALSRDLAGLPSNTIGQQLWCVVGARESYSRAIEVGEWAGFGCSLDPEGIVNASRVARALDRSGAGILVVLTRIESFTDQQNRLLVDLLEHEAAHHGQLIRYLYGLRLPIPAGWKARYALD